MSRLKTLSFSMIFLALFQVPVIATDSSNLNSKPTYGDRMSTGIGNVLSGRTDSDHMYGREPYSERVSEKLGRGLTNFFLGGYEIKKSYVEEYDKSNLLAPSLTTGVFKGIVRTAKRMIVGAYEFFTCPFPQDPILQPEYVTDKSL